MAASPTPSARTDYSALKAAIHRRLIQKLDLDRLNQLKRDEVRREVGQILENLVAGESTPMNLQERERLSLEVLDEVFGLGPLEKLLVDPTISDILVNNYKSVYIERRGLLELTGMPAYLLDCSAAEVLAARDQGELEKDENVLEW